jgi:hypothetical protein
VGPRELRSAPERWVAIQTRSGNPDQPQKNWSPWSDAVIAPKGWRIASPAARFVQWKATLTADSGGRTPELESVGVAYLAKSVIGKNALAPCARRC